MAASGESRYSEKVKTLMCTLVALLVSASAQAKLPSVVGQDSPYNVKPGQNLSKIAQKAGLALEHITFANKLPLQLESDKKQRLILPGRRILPREHPDTGIAINLPERGGYLFQDQKFVGFFPIAIGAPAHKTPIGHFKVNSMMKNPTWLPPEWAKEEGPVLPGPDNPLGDRWIGLNSPGLGMHATNAPDSVGGDVSHGCMRTYPKVAHRLFEFVHKGMPVWIVYEPVKFGLDSQGRLNSQVFPDVYLHNNMVSRANRVLKRENLQKQVPEQLLKQLVAQPNGVTRLLAD